MVGTITKFLKERLKERSSWGALMVSGMGFMMKFTPFDNDMIIEITAELTALLFFLTSDSKKETKGEKIFGTKHNKNC